MEAIIVLILFAVSIGCFIALGIFRKRDKIPERKPEEIPKLEIEVTTFTGIRQVEETELDRLISEGSKHLRKKSYDHQAAFRCAREALMLVVDFNNPRKYLIEMQSVMNLMARVWLKEKKYRDYLYYSVIHFICHITNTSISQTEKYLTEIKEECYGGLRNISELQEGDEKSYFVKRGPMYFETAAIELGFLGKDAEFVKEIYDFSFYEFPEILARSEMPQHIDISAMTKFSEKLLNKYIAP